MENSTTYLFAFRRFEDGELAFLGDHGALLSGEIPINPAPTIQEVDILIFIVTIEKSSQNKARVEFDRAMKYPLSKDGKPQFFSNRSVEISVTEQEKRDLSAKAITILSSL